MEGLFQMVDEYGSPVISAGDVHGNLDVRGLLLYKGGTVCDDDFSTYSADVICKMLVRHSLYRSFCGLSRQF